MPLPVATEAVKNTDLLSRLNAVRERAVACGLPARRKDSQLYSLLADCLSLCEQTDRAEVVDALRGAVQVHVDARNPELLGRGRESSNNGKGRRYVETSSDVYILVTRYVLDGHDSRNSIYRYATALREAAKRQVRAVELAGWLTENGGIRALYAPEKLTHQADLLRKCLAACDTKLAALGVPATAEPRASARRFLRV